MSRQRAAEATSELLEVLRQRPGTWLKFAKWSEHNPAFTWIATTPDGDLQWMVEGIPTTKATRRSPRNGRFFQRWFGVELAVRGSVVYARWMPPGAGEGAVSS